MTPLKHPWTVGKSENYDETNQVLDFAIKKKNKGNVWKEWEQTSVCLELGARDIAETGWRTERRMKEDGFSPYSVTGVEHTSDSST